jgi:hypothetical protein
MEEKERVHLTQHLDVVLRELVDVEVSSQLEIRREKSLRLISLSPIDKMDALKKRKFCLEHNSKAARRLSGIWSSPQIPAPYSSAITQLLHAFEPQSLNILNPC